MGAWDNGGKVARVDAATGALMCITYEHHEIHSGSHFFVDDVEDLAINSVFDLQFTTPDNTKWSHFVFTLATEVETLWYIYEDVTINLAGTTITPMNNNRNSATTSQNTLAGILNTSLANAETDTDTAAATILAHGISGAGRNSGVQDRAHEIILKQGTSYCFRAVASAAGYTNFLINWYEHTDRN